MTKSILESYKEAILGEEKLDEGTGNFHNANASHIFAIDDLYYTDEETGEEVEDEFIFDDTISNVESEMDAVCKDKRWSANDGFDSKEELRSFPSTKVAGWYDYEAIDYEDEDGEDEQVQIETQLSAYFRSGYYQSGNFDWEIEYTINGVDYDHPDDFENDDYLDFPEDVKKEIVEKINNTADEMIETVEKIFGNYTGKYAVSARFSSGETHYSKVEENLKESSYNIDGVNYPIYTVSSEDVDRSSTLDQDDIGRKYVLVNGSVQLLSDEVVESVFEFGDIGHPSTNSIIYPTEDPEVINSNKPADV